MAILFLIYCVNCSLQRWGDRVFVAFPPLTTPFVSKTWSSSKNSQLPSIHTHKTSKKHEAHLNPKRILTLKSTRYHTWLYRQFRVNYWISVTGRHYRNGLKCWPCRELPPFTLLTCWVKTTEGPNNLIHTMSSDCIQTWLESSFHLLSVISQFPWTVLMAHQHNTKTTGFTILLTMKK